MNKKHMGKPPIYDEAFKISVARRYLNSDLGFDRLGKELGLAGHTIQHFVKWYKARYPEGEVPARSAEPVEPVDPQAASELEQLRQQLKMAQLKVTAYETMIAIAKKDLDIDIVKKFGAKQSGK